MLSSCNYFRVGGYAGQRTSRRNYSIRFRVILDGYCRDMDLVLNSVLTRGSRLRAWDSRSKWLETNSGSCPSRVWAFWKPRGVYSGNTRFTGLVWV